MATMVRMVLLQLLRLGANSVRLLRKTMPQVFWNHKLKVQNNQFQKKLKVHLCGSGAGQRYCEGVSFGRRKVLLIGDGIQKRIEE